MMEVVGCRCPKMAVLKIFEIPMRYHETESIFSKVKDLTFATFWRRTPQLTFIWNLAKHFEQLFPGKCFCFDILQWITGFTSRLVLLFCETNVVTRTSVLQRTFKWTVRSEHLALTAWKRYYISLLQLHTSSLPLPEGLATPPDLLPLGLLPFNLYASHHYFQKSIRMLLTLWIEIFFKLTKL